MEEPVILTKQDILTGGYTSFMAKKAVADRIRPFTQNDVDNVHQEFEQDEHGTYFPDLEGRRHGVELGRCLVIGVSAEDRRTTSQEKVDRYRYPVSSADPDHVPMREWVGRHYRPETFSVPQVNSALALFISYEHAAY